MAGKSYKSVAEKGELGSVVSDAYSQLEDLAGELEEWKSGLEGTALKNTSRYEMLNEAVDALGNKSEPDVPDSLDKIEVGYSISVKRNKKAGCSRAVRLENIVGMMQAVVEELDSVINNEDEKDEDKKEEAETLKSELEDTIGEIDGTDIPGMFG